MQAVVDSVDQGASSGLRAPASRTGRCGFAFPAIGAAFEGTMEPDGSAVAGTWSQGGRALPLTFRRLAAPFAVERPQEPKGPFPYAAEEVTFRSPAGGVELAGTFVLPPGEGPFPAVAMISGSGPQDRDESLMGHKPFLVIADHLARHGIASLRWDDRGTGASGGDHLGSTIDDFAADARAAVAFLAARPGVDSGAVGLLGHSEGGLIAPRVAAEDRRVAFLVLLAPPGEPLPDLLMRQARAAYRLRGVDAGLVDRALATQAADLALVADPALSGDELAARLRERSAARRRELTPEEQSRLGIDDAAVERGIRLSTSAWFRSLMRQDPAVALRQVHVPVLALFAGKDFQVDPEVNAAALRAALRQAGDADVEVRILPGLNHLFQHAGTGGIDEYGTIEETFAPEALTAVTDWISAHSAAGGPPAGG